MSFGLGAVTGALLAGRSVRHLGARNTTVVGLVAAGLLVIVYARQTQVVPGLVIFGLVGIPIAALNAGLTPQILATVPPHYLGRVLGVFNPLNQLAGMFSVVVSGWLASTALYRFHHTVAGIRLGPIDTIFAGSGLLVLLAGCYAHLALPRAASRRPEVSRTRPAG